VELAAVALGVRPGPEVRAWFAGRFLPELEAGLEGRPVGPPPPRPAPAPPPPPERLPWREVLSAWHHAAPVVDVRLEGGALVAVPDPRAGGWLEARARSWPSPSAADLAAGLAVAELSGEPLARLVGPAACPSWATMGGRSWATGWPLALPCYDARGQLVALRARRCAWSVDADGAPAELRGGAVWSGDTWQPVDGPAVKEVSPRGAGACRGAVYADAVGRAVLRGEVAPGDALRPDRWRSSAGTLRWSGAVVVVEGGVDYLRRATEPPRGRAVAAGDARPAVLGVWSGAWPDDAEGDALADALRRAGARLVAVATDDDGAGEGYAAAVAATLARAGVPYRVRVARGRVDG
jgi:hypothetical protein